LISTHGAAARTSYRPARNRMLIAAKHFLLSFHPDVSTMYVLPRRSPRRTDQSLWQLPGMWLNRLPNARTKSCAAISLRRPILAVEKNPGNSHIHTSLSASFARNPIQFPATKDAKEHEEVLGPNQKIQQEQG
jgi:hypothetical protein